MSTACSYWMTIFSCMRQNPRKIKSLDLQKPNRSAFDAIIVWKGKEGAKRSTGGVAYDYILKPATDNALPRPISPPKEKPITQEEIFRKLKAAEERRQSLEQQKVQFAAKEKNRVQEVLAKSMEEEEKFAREVKAKLRRSLEVTKENRNMQIQALQEKLRDHLTKVEEVYKKSDTMAKDLRLEEKITQKLEASEENRNAKIQAQLTRLRNHAKHIEDVCKASENIGKISEEKIILKMENALKNREEYYRALQDRLKEHEKKIEEVRRNKMSISTGSVQ
ncbi:stathmin-2-like isoform X1 [Mytilus trossulus]|uniref:stathmin-2-like isoform X1 n=1 Tax=Mytilus trossulus TaxID=6551 RepID=UPI0030056C9A